MMRIGIMPEQGDIVLIPIPFTDLSSQKRRPVIVISNNQYNAKTTDVVVVAMTSNPQPTDYSFPDFICQFGQRYTESLGQDSGRQDLHNVSNNDCEDVRSRWPATLDRIRHTLQDIVATK